MVVGTYTNLNNLALAFYDCGSFTLCVQKKRQGKPPILQLLAYVFSCCIAEKQCLHRYFELLTLMLLDVFFFRGRTCVCNFLNKYKQRNRRKCYSKRKIQTSWNIVGKLRHHGESKSIVLFLQCDNISKFSHVCKKELIVECTKLKRHLWCNCCKSFSAKWIWTKE